MNNFSKKFELPVKKRQLTWGPEKLSKEIPEKNPEVYREEYLKEKVCSLKYRKTSLENLNSI